MPYGCYWRTTNRGAREKPLRQYGCGNCSARWWYVLWWKRTLFPTAIQTAAPRSASLVRADPPNSEIVEKARKTPLASVYRGHPRIAAQPTPHAPASSLPGSRLFPGSRPARAGWVNGPSVGTPRAGGPVGVSVRLALATTSTRYANAVSGKVPAPSSDPLSSTGAFNHRPDCLFWKPQALETPQAPASSTIVARKYPRKYSARKNT
jgi:hypothetical protein